MVFRRLRTTSIPQLAVYDQPAVCMPTWGLVWEAQADGEGQRIAKVKRAPSARKLALSMLGWFSSTKSELICAGSLPSLRLQEVDVPVRMLRVQGR